MNESVTISKNTETRDDRDFDFLRREGLKHIEAMCRKLWTDYNSHDPGITLLEALSYAITDLGNRIDLPMQDLLAVPEADSGSTTENFPTAKQIFTTKPVSETDYRKLLIDIEGVNNVFIQVHSETKIVKHCLLKDEATDADPQGKLSYKESLPHYEKAGSFSLKGLYDIYFEPNSDIQIMDDTSEVRKALIAEIKEQVIAAYHANRNLCEDLEIVKEVNYLDVLVCGDIEIERNANPTKVLVEIMFRIQEYLSPSVKRYTLDQLLEKGVAVEDIYEGPVLNNGFILNEELEKAAIKREVRLSDLVQIVSETPGVSVIRKLKMGRCAGETVSEDLRNKNKQKWTMCLNTDEKTLPRLCMLNSIKITNLYKDVIPVDVDAEEAKEKLEERIQLHQQSLRLSYDDIPIANGRYVELDQYRSVQNDLPEMYGTGEYGLSPSLPPERHAKAKQLKSYMLFFDQILATYFGHLRSMGNLLSGDVGTQSYFATPISDVKDFNDLVKNPTLYTADVQHILEGLDDYQERKNQFLDHLLARFAENMNEYAFAMLEGFGEDVTGATLWHKSALLREYPQVSANRSCGFNYFAGKAEAWDTRAVTGLQHRLARLLGIRDYSRRDLTLLDYDIYQEEDADDDDNEWRWRLKDKDGNIMFSSSMHYPDKSSALKEMWQTVSLAWDPGNYDLRLTEDEDEHYFNIIDENREVIARHMKYFDTPEEAKAQIEHLTAYLFDYVADEGLYVFEHILLRPDPDDEDAGDKFMPICMNEDCTQCKPGDPYSLRLSIVLPGWIRRFSNLYFREYAEKVIRREVPAHILCRICWIGNTSEDEEGEISTTGGQMSQLGELYKKWLTKKMQNPDNQTDNEFLKPLADLLHDLVTVYPEGRLHDCDANGGDSETSIILGKSTIGELKQENNGDK